MRQSRAAAFHAAVRRHMLREKERPLTQIIRPEARAFLSRWSEVIVAAALLALGLWWGLTSGGLIMVTGWALVVIALSLAWSALQRMRFATSDQDEGVVDVVEGQISYFSPVGGGFASLTEMTEIRLIQTGHRRSWVLVSQGLPDLVIPVGAAGAEKLFDAFGALPGLTSGTLIAALQGDATPATGQRLPANINILPRVKIIWNRPVTRTLH